MKIKTIVMGYDFSKASQAALHEAMRLALLFKAKLRVIHAMAPEIAAPFMPILSADIKNEVEKNLNEELQKVVAQAKTKLDVEAKVLQGLPHRVLIEEAKKEEADLIVVGPHGHSTLGRLILGSEAFKLVRHSPVSVYLYQGTERELKKIWVPLDENPDSEFAVQQALDWAQGTSAKVQLVHGLAYPVYDYLDSSALYEEAKIQSKKYFEAVSQKYCLSLPALIWAGPIAYVLKNEIEKNPEVGLVVLSTHSHKVLERFLMGSTAEQILWHVPVSVLAVKSPNQTHEASSLLAKGILFS